MKESADKELKKNPRWQNGLRQSSWQLMTSFIIQVLPLPSPSLKYTFSRLTDNILDFTRNYSFKQYEGKTKLSCEIWLENEGFPIRESLFELYLWFGQERGMGKKP